MRLKIPTNKDKITSEICYRSFYKFCQYISPDFYTDERTHLTYLCNKLQDFYERKILKPDGTPYTNLAISIPPRLGKSRTLELFSVWIFGRNPSEKIMTVSYNETLAVEFSKSVRDKIQTPRSSAMRTVSDVFPDLKIKQGSGAAHMWAIDGKHISYLGGSPTGTLTGIGASVLIIDDLIKNALEALNERVLSEHWLFYTNTLRQRLEEGHIKIVNFTRWSTRDLIGRLIADSPKDWYVIEMEAMRDDVMLCPSLLSYESYVDIRKGMLPAIFAANYHQKPIDVEGRMYKSLKTYTDIPAGVIKNYTDTADEGSDWLCSITYVEHKKEAYIIDVVYTQQGMEVTERLVAEMLYNQKANTAMIESNNGGRGFARAVDRILKQDLKTNRTVIKWFHQSQNKVARIVSQSAWVQEHIHFPQDWSTRWPEFYRDVTSYVKGGKSQHDDAPDSLTGIAEQTGRTGVYMF
jgi:predicted phage terminase large subunit-like protein